MRRKMRAPFRRAAAAALALAAWAPLAHAADAPEASVNLPVRFAGLPVGAMEYTVRVEGDRYTVDGTGRTGGVGRLVSSASSTFRSRGRLGDGRPVPQSHSVSYRDGAKEGTAAIRFRPGARPTASETPPPTPGKSRVPVTDAMLEGALDPTSAMLVPAPPDASAATVCGRTIRVWDARNVFDLALAPQGSNRLADGTPTHVCTVRYTPLGGHSSTSRGVQRFSRNRSIRIEFAPLFPVGAAEGTGLWGLVGFRMKTRFGIVRGRAEGVDGP